MSCPQFSVRWRAQLRVAKSTTCPQGLTRLRLIKPV